MIPGTEEVFGKYLFNKLITGGCSCSLPPYQQKEMYGMMLPKLLTVFILG